MAATSDGFIQYDFENRVAFQNTIKKAAKLVGDLRFPMGEISRDFYKSEKAIFQLSSAGGFPDFKNARSRNQKLREVGFTYPLLKRSGKLERSLTEPNATGSINIISKRDVIIGSSVKYIVHFQFGTKFMAARPPVFIGPESKAFAARDRANKGGRLTRWTNIIESYVQAVLNAQGF